MRARRSIARCVGVVCACLTLAACSLGGGAGHTPSPPPTNAWDQIVEQNAQSDGSVSLQTARSAFAFAIAPLPGVNVPATAGPAAAIRSRTIALDWVRAYWSQLTLEQQRAVVDAIGAPAVPRADARLAVGTHGHAPTPMCQDQAGLTTYRAQLNTVARGMAIHLGGPPNIPGGICLATRHLALGGADTPCWDAQGSDIGTPNYCVIELDMHTGVTGSEGPNFWPVILAHELFHCYEVGWMTIAQFGTIETRSKWVSEGAAEWVAQTIAGPSHDAATQAEWGYYLTNPGFPLIQRAYSAIGFYAQLWQSGTNVWTVLKPMLLAAQSSNSAAFHAGTDPGGDAILLWWASGYLRRPSLGAYWNIQGPGITGDRAAPSRAVITAAPLAVAVAAWTNRMFALTATSDIVTFQIPANARLHDASTVDSTALDGTSFCLNPKGCACPQNMLYAGPALQSALASPVYLAVSGGAAGIKGTLQGVSLASVCKQSPCPVSNAEVSQIVGGQVALVHVASYDSPGGNVHVTDCDYVGSGLGDLLSIYQGSGAAAAYRQALAYVQGINGFTVITVGGIGDAAFHTVIGQSGTIEVSGLWVLKGDVALKIETTHTCTAAHQCFNEAAAEALARLVLSRV